MLAIGRALMARPRVLLLDEPSMGLAPQVISEIYVAIREINRQGATVLLVEQNARKALAISHFGYVWSRDASSSKAMRLALPPIRACLAPIWAPIPRLQARPTESQTAGPKNPAATGAIRQPCPRIIFASKNNVREVRYAESFSGALGSCQHWTWTIRGS